MKKLLFLLSLYLFMQSHHVIAMELSEFQKQRTAFEGFMNIGFCKKDEYDKEDLYAYLKRGDIDINEKQRWGACLHIACIREDEKVVKTILEHSDVDKDAVTDDDDDGKKTSLVIACFRQCKSIIELLLHHDVDINIETNAGNTALLHACVGHDRPEIVSLLLVRDELDMNEEHGNANAMLTATEYGRNKILNMLYDCPKVNREQKDAYNRNFFYVFVQGEYDPCLLHFFNAFEVVQKKEFLSDQLCQAVCTSDFNYIPFSYERMNIFVKMCNLHGVDWNAKNTQEKRPVDVAEDEYNRVKNGNDCHEKVWKQLILQLFLRHTPYVFDHELFYRLRERVEINDIMHVIFYYYYMLTIERDIALAMPTEYKEYRSKCTEQAMMELRNQLLKEKLKPFQEICAATLSQ